jgi:hypothetical protein
VGGNHYTLAVEANGVGLPPTWDVGWSINEIPSYLDFHSGYGTGYGTRPPANVDFFEGKLVPPLYENLYIFSQPNEMGLNFAKAVVNKSWSPVAYYDFVVNYSGGLIPVLTSLTLTPYATFLADNVSGSYSWRLSGRSIDFPVTVLSQAYLAARCNGADMTGDGLVDGLDYGVWQANYQIQDRIGACGVSNNWCNWGDASKDGKVDGLDYGVWQANYNRRDCVKI